MYYLLDTHNEILENLVPPGTKYKEVNTTTIKNYEIPVPPKNIQNKIIDDCKRIDNSSAEILTEGIPLSEVQAELTRRKSEVFDKHFEE